MKENSIEEDITRVKQRIEDVKEYIEYGLSYSEYLDLENSFDNILSDYKRVLKENEELKEKENKIYKEVQESLSFEKFLIVKERKPDLFNQGRFYISQIIYDILNDVQNPEGIHKENKCIQYIDYIPIQKVKDKIEELKKKVEELTDDKGYWGGSDLLEQIKVLQELLEKEQ